jgi:hypothetical protein
VNFHVTHNTKYQHQLFYCRQEVWSNMSEQNFNSLTNVVFEKIPSEKINEVLNSKELGYSKINFIPKDDEGNLKPIVNMKCSMYKTVSYFYIILCSKLINITVFNLKIKPTSVVRKSPSINAILNNTFQILKYEIVRKYYYFIIKYFCIYNF